MTDGEEATQAADGRGADGTLPLVLAEKQLVSTVCEDHGMSSTLFYDGHRVSFKNGESARWWTGGELYLKGTNLLDSAFVASRRPFGARASQPQMLFVGYRQSFGEPQAL